MYNVLVYISLLYLCSRDELETSCLLSSVRHEMGGFIRLLHVHGPYVCVQKQGRRQHKTESTKESLGLLATELLGRCSLGFPLSGEEGGDASEGGLLMNSVSIGRQLSRWGRRNGRRKKDKDIIANESDSRVE